MKKLDMYEEALERQGMHRKKELQFNEVLEVKSLELDIYQAEQKDSVEKLPFRSKFMIRSIRNEH